jgi:hypothetical protein
MNDSIGPELPSNPEAPATPPTLPSTPCNAPAPIPWRRWLRGFLATNPFYLLSAALLLYGIYRISVGPGLFTAEAAQLAFNFGSLQCYEILLVGTALLLARRAIWYDSTLLTCVENALLVVPFMLVSQAALIEQKWVWGFCGAGVALAAARAGALKTCFQHLNWPARALGCGAAVLAFNAALPVVYRHLHESKVGTKPTEGAAYEFNEWSWLALLPALIAVANLLPKPRATGALWPQRRWLPFGLFLLWLAATATHLYSLGYVYDFDLRRELVAPAVWALAWMLSRRLTDLVEFPGWKLNRALLVIPAVTPFVAGFTNNKITLGLAALNVLAYGALAICGTQTRIARNLAIGSALAVMASLPHQWGGVIVPGFSPAKAIAAAALTALILPALLSRNPKLGFLGAAALAVGVAGYLGSGWTAFNWAMQAGCVFLLLHSLRWFDWQEKGLGIARGLVAGLWMAHSFAWAHAGTAGFALAATSLPVLTVWVTLRQLRWVQGRNLIPVAATLVLLSSPLDFAGRWLAAAPAGLLALLGSLALFALGTAAALTKHRWHGPAAEP